MTILDEIIRNKQKEVNKKLTSAYFDQLEKKNSRPHKIRDFKSALLVDSLSIIAEIKKASPSKGLIRPDFNPVDIAVSYEKNGAACISILTEEKYFQGHPDYLAQVRQNVKLPILRKDFITDERQVTESYLLGADAILLIVKVLDEGKLRHLLRSAEKIGLHILVEVHSKAELDIALKCKSKIIGINNRNLDTFKTDIETSIRIKENVPNTIVTVSESGINTSLDCKLLSDNRFNAALIGESLMRKPDPGAYIAELLKDC